MKLLRKNFISAVRLGNGLVYLKSNTEFDKIIGIYGKAGYRKLESALGDSIDPVWCIWMVKELLYL